MMVMDLGFDIYLFCDPSYIDSCSEKNQFKGVCFLISLKAPGFYIIFPFSKKYGISFMGSDYWFDIPTVKSDLCELFLTLQCR